MDEETVTRLWSRLEALYMCLSNKLYLKKQVYELHMKEETIVLEHLNFCIYLLERSVYATLMLENADLESCCIYLPMYLYSLQRKVLQLSPKHLDLFVESQASWYSWKLI